MLSRPMTGTSREDRFGKSKGSNISRYIDVAMNRGALVAPTFPFLARGRFRILLLRTLEDQPMHGYEVMKVLEERFQGFYKPSAGAIYPALRSLLREGYVAVSGAERRKTYRIMPKGRAFLRSHEADMEKRFRAFESAVGSERASLFRELRTTGKLLGANLKSITPDQAEELRAVVVQMRERMMRILAK